MNTKHILIEKAFIYKKKQKKFKNKNYIYNHSLGYWIQKNNKKPAIYDTEFPVSMTKKADIETGEDQKGE